MTKENPSVRTAGLSQGVSLKPVDGSDHYHGPQQSAVDRHAAGLDVDYVQPLPDGTSHPERHGHPHNPSQPTFDPAGVMVPPSIKEGDMPEPDTFPQPSFDPSHGPLDLATKKHEGTDPNAAAHSGKPGGEEGVSPAGPVQVPADGGVVNERKSEDDHKSEE
jgi:hypothetical protein